MKYNFTTSSGWVAENDAAIYDTLHEKLIDLVNDENNYTTDEEDLKEFEKGNWIVEYVFRDGNKPDEVEILVTAGRTGQRLASQPAWIQENAPKKEFMGKFDSLYSKMVYIEI